MPVPASGERPVLKVVSETLRLFPTDEQSFGDFDVDTVISVSQKYFLDEKELSETEYETLLERCTITQKTVYFTNDEIEPTSEGRVFMIALTNEYFLEDTPRNGHREYRRLG